MTLLITDLIRVGCWLFPRTGAFDYPLPLQTLLIICILTVPVDLVTGAIYLRLDLRRLRWCDLTTFGVVPHCCLLVVTFTHVGLRFVCCAIWTLFEAGGY